MSEEMRLPAELAACEARLAAHALPASGIERDALLYQAGWAAAVAQANAIRGDAGGQTIRLDIGDNPPHSKEGAWGEIGSAKKVTFAWSAISAAIAASLAVVATLELRPPRLIEVAAKATPAAAAAVAEAQLAKEDSAAKTHQSPLPSFRIALPRGDFEAGLIGLRQQALVGMLREPPRSRSADGKSGAGVPTAKSVRELMDELLPQDADRSAQLWPWSRLAPGESI